MKYLDVYKISGVVLLYSSGAYLSIYEACKRENTNRIFTEVGLSHYHNLNAMAIANVTVKYNIHRHGTHFSVGNYIIKMFVTVKWFFFFCRSVTSFWCVCVCSSM